MGISEQSQRAPLRPILWLLAAAVLGVTSACSPNRTSGTVQVFAASSLTDAFGELVEAFEANEPTIDVELVLGGSSSLREQVLDGAQADVFASANVAVMADLVDAGATKGPPSLFAANTLALVVPAGNPAGITTIGQLDDTKLVLGLCAPEVPCGAAAIDLFALAGFDPRPDTEEPNVRALLAKVEAGELDAGVVYHSDVSGSTVETVPLPDELMVEVDYSIALVAGPSGTRSYSEADAFIGFVLSPAGQSILRAHGLAEPSIR